MCWSAEVSLNTFLFAGFCNTLAYFNNVLSLPAFLFNFSFISMLLVEYGVWKGYDNVLMSMIGYLLILSQPIFAIFKILNIELRNKLLTGYGLILIVLFNIYKWSSIDFRTTIAKNGHLLWHWLDTPFAFFLVYIFLLLFPFYYNHEYIELVYYSGFLLLSIFLYLKYRTWDTLWCWIANFAALYWIYKIFQKNKLGCGIK